MKLFLSAFTIVIAFLITTDWVHAVCPVCTVAVGAGLGVSRWIGIDDTVTGIWIGGLIVSSGLWLADWIGKKGWKVPYKETVSVGLFFLFVIPALYWGKMIGFSGNSLWGVDKVFLGIATGSTIFLFGVWVDRWLRTLNNGKVYIYYQKMIVPVLMLALASFIFYLITC